MSACLKSSSTYYYPSLTCISRGLFCRDYLRSFAFFKSCTLIIVSQYYHILPCQKFLVLTFLPRHDKLRELLLFIRIIPPHIYRLINPRPPRCLPKLLIITTSLIRSIPHNIAGKLWQLICIMITNVCGN